MFCQIYPQYHKLTEFTLVLPNVTMFNINNQVLPSFAKFCCLAKFNLNNQVLPSFARFNLDSHG
jgi:hypothetical protein